MKTLVIAEKPSVGRDIARVLNCTKKQNGCIEGNRYVVTWGLGHLVTLAAPENYDKKYKVWKMEDIPIMPNKFEIEVIKQTAKQYGVVKQLIHRKDIENIVIATDAGREGELVARWILEKAKNQKPCKRLWISSVTDKAIKEGFSKLKSAKEYENLYYAAVARAEADWLVGLNATRALTCKYNAQLSCGRVQTPTLSMIAKRENEIKNFKPETYYGITVQSNGIVFTWRDEKSGSYRSFSKERMEEILNKIKEDSINIIKVDKKDKKSYAPLLYDLTELQREANKRFGYSAKETLNILQRLYENHKVLTYPRTDSRYITTDIVETLEERIRACAIGPYKKMAGNLLKSRPIEGKKAFVNNSKVSDHHAIIPTEQYPEFIHMTNEEKKLYDLVVKRFLAVLYPPCEYVETVLIGVICGEKFYAKGNVIIKNGWKEVYHSIEDDEIEEPKGLKEQKLPLVEEGQTLKEVKVKLSEGQTKPPAKFNEATLLSAMENPIKYMECKDQQMAKTLGETGGLGTVATRADIIDKLFSSFFIEKKGEEISVTSKGKQLLDLVPEDLKKPELTAKWEMNFSQIAKGQLKSSIFMNEIRTYTLNIIEQIKFAEGIFRHDNLTNKICPQCGKRLLKVNGKNSKMLVCQDRNCGYRETISRITNARCPVCHKKMEMVGNKDEGLFVCVCGHKERLSKFQERRKKEGAGVSKKDVKRYLNKQKDEPINNAFADALKRMK
ncbi:DNA topoisomerase III [Anaerosacchariphilus polymeriproducens]|uniref:DNA topoisomerase 3 n=1 Tax=Anaerosacchariphilus polymeriproducens TaxID=1812858 RepID=A0A371AZ39_9FIRM|nr:DNA topoisomerase III [Anaerosacchariphilus polymeriproducens]RDU24816.1 DNA topoisomerase III [Anaerosacchariphilus polymeriproducens]